MMLLWPWFVTEGIAGLSFCTHCALSIDGNDKLNRWIREKCTQPKPVKSAYKCGVEQFISFSSFLHYSLLFNKSSQSHAVAHTPSSY